MFTGIVQTKGRVHAMDDRPFGKRVVIDVGDWLPAHCRTPEEGDSICVSGICLTVVDFSDGRFAFDVITETLAKTMLGTLSPGSFVNIEPSVTAAQPLGGHFMQGHIDGVGEVTEVKEDAADWRIAIRPAKGLMDYMIPKGSVAIDGVSLTIASVMGDCFDVALIPTTLDVTTLGETKAGDIVNLEADIISKTVVTRLQQMSSSQREEVSVDLLRAAGFAE